MSVTYPIIQAPPVMKATTGFGPSLFLGKNKSSLQRKYTINQNYNSYNLQLWRQRESMNKAYLLRGLSP